MKVTDRIRNKFLQIFGDIKVFKYPLFLVYDPGSYLVKGHEIRKVLNTIKKGDILLRGYKNYLDGYFIPGFFSHAGLYLGQTKKSDLTDKTKEHIFYEGEQVAIHSMAEGVFMEDIINFCKCDYLIILRRSTQIESEAEIESSFDQTFNKAMTNLGKDYDFAFNFSDIHNMSCTEFVYNCCDNFLPKYDVKIKTRTVLFKKRELLTPDDFVTDKFKIAFRSASIKPEKLNAIMGKNKA